MLLKRIKDWYPIIREDEDWDFDYLFDIIEFKLTKMMKYFSTHNIVVDEEKYAKQIQVALNILKAGYKTDIVLDTDLKTYVNTRNCKRFLPKSYLFDKFSNEGGKFWTMYGNATIREYKAKALFWKYLHHYIENWWD